MKIGLVQINNGFLAQSYLPYSVGVLQAYAQSSGSRSGRWQFFLPLYKRCLPEDAVRGLMKADIVFFSTYVWNEKISLAIAKNLKARRPDAVVVFGGPQVPDRAEGYLRKHPYVDVVCHGEGEKTFLSVLENADARRWDRVPSVDFLRSDGSFVATPRAPRMSDLAGLTSPYLEGVFDALMEAHPEEKWIAIWETNRGCPFSCTFCDWGSAIQTRVYPFDTDRLFREFEWFAKHRIEFVFCADANFGLLPRDVRIAEYAARVRRENGYPLAFSVQNTKNATERAYQIQKTLAAAGLNKGVTLSLQSLDASVLKNVKRSNISTKAFQELQRRFSEEGVETYTDIILGLPNETYDTFVQGVSDVIENGQHNRIQFNNLSILPNAEMADPAYRDKYGIKTVDCRIVNMHGTLDELPGDPQETQQLVVATSSMPGEDWIRSRVFSWTAAFLHFDKVLQIPFVLLRHAGKVSYRVLIELFSGGGRPKGSVLGEINDFFLDKARKIQSGDAEYCRSEKWLNIWWPADEFVFIKLCAEDKLDRFYREAEEELGRFLSAEGIVLPHGLLQESVWLNRYLLKLPSPPADKSVRLSYNIWEVYRAALKGRPVPLRQRSCLHGINHAQVTWQNWEDWLREVVWYGNKKGAYLYQEIEDRDAGPMSSMRA